MSLTNSLYSVCISHDRLIFTEIRDYFLSSYIYEQITLSNITSSLFNAWSLVLKSKRSCMNEKPFAVLINVAEFHGPMKTNPATWERGNLHWMLQYLTCFFCLLKYCMLQYLVAILYAGKYCVLAILYVMLKLFFPLGLASLTTWIPWMYWSSRSLDLRTVFTQLNAVMRAAHFEQRLHASHIFRKESSRVQDTFYSLGIMRPCLRTS